MIRIDKWRASGAALLLAALVAGVSLWLSRSGPPQALSDLAPRAQEEFHEHFETARERIGLGKWREAETALEHCLSLFDGDPEVHVSLGEVYLGLRLEADPGVVTEDEEDALIDRALAAFDRALEIQPGTVSALKQRWRTRRDASLRRYDPDGALQDAEEVLNLAPEDSRFRELHVLWLVGMVRFQRAREGRAAFDSSIGLEVAERHLERMLDRAPEGTAEYARALQGLGQTSLFMGDFKRAVEYLEKLIAVPLEVEMKASILQDLGLSLYRLGEYEEAAGCFLRSFDLRETLEARWLLRLAYEGLGRDVGDLPERYRFSLPPEDVDPSSPPKIRFTEVGEALGVAKVDGAGPSAFADFDGDGDPDILAAGCDTFTALYRHDGEKYTDVTVQSGLHEVESGFSTNMVDYDNDGQMDIYCCRNGWNGPARNILLRGKGDGTFEDRSRESGLDDPGCGFVSLWADFDRDGLLDVGSTNRLYRNRGDGTFEDATESAGLAESRRWGTIGAAVGDYDRDGDPDIFVNGRRYGPNRLYRNRGDGTFDEVGKEAGVLADVHHGYVAFFIDYDNDARPDILTTSLAKWKYVLKGLTREVVPTAPHEVQTDASRLYRNKGDGTFVDVTYESKLFFPHGVMGANVADLDNDGHIDIYYGTGAPDFKRLEPSAFYRNNGDGTFTDLTRFAGLDHLGKGHGVTFADYDHDGDLDIYAPQGGFFHGDLWANPLYRNDGGNENHWLHLRLWGVKSNRFAVGAQVTLKAGGTVQYREVTGGIGFGSTNSYPVEFGLGDRTQVDEVEILWPGGHRQVLQSPPVDSMIEAREFEEGFRVIHEGGSK